MLLLSVLISGVLIGVVYACVALGFSVALGACRVVNFAHGHFVVVGAYIAFLFAHAGFNVYLSVIVAALITGAMGVAVYRGLIRPFAPLDAAGQIALTLGVAILLENAIALAFGPDPVTVRHSGSTVLAASGGALRVSVPRLLAGAIGIAALSGSWWLFQRNRWGLAIRAAGDSIMGAELTGYGAKGVLSMGMAISVGLAGVSGAILLPIENVSPYDALDFTLRSFVIVVVGGVGSPRGILVTGILLGVIESMAGFAGSPDLGTVAVYSLLILALGVRRVFERATILELSDR